MTGQDTRTNPSSGCFASESGLPPMQWKGLFLQPSSLCLIAAGCNLHMHYNNKSVFKVASETYFRGHWDIAFQD